MRVWLKDRYRRFLARVIATYIRRRSSSRPSTSDIEFSCGNRPSSRPVMNTQSNSSPLAECTVISCTASCPACAWLSPASSAACVRNAASGETISPVSASGVTSTAATACRHAGGDRARGLVDRQRDRILAEALLRDEGLGGVDQLFQVLDAVGAFLLGAVEVDQPARLQHVLDDLAQGRAARGLAHRVDQRVEGAQVGARLARQRAGALVAGCAR